MYAGFIFALNKVTSGHDWVLQKTLLLLFHSYLNNGYSATMHSTLNLLFQSLMNAVMCEWVQQHHKIIKRLASDMAFKNWQQQKTFCVRNLVFLFFQAGLIYNWFLSVMLGWEAGWIFCDVSSLPTCHRTYAHHKNFIPEGNKSVH